EEVTALAVQQGLATGSLEDGVMGVMRFHSGVIAQFHDSFTIKHAGTGFQVHGTEGSLMAENVMSQVPVGQIFLQRDGKREEIKLDPPENLYIHAVRLFNDAVKGNGQPAATGEDGIRSVAIALAVLESTRSHAQVKVRYS